MRRAVTSLLTVTLVVGGCSLIDRDLPESATTEVGSDGFELELDGVTVSGRAGVAEVGTTVSGTVLADPAVPDLHGLASVAGPTVEVILGDGKQPAEPITLRFTDSQMADALAVLTEQDDRADLFAVTADDGLPTAAVDHLSIFTLIEVDVDAWWSQVSRGIDTVLGLHTPRPDCPEPTPGSERWVASADPDGVVWPCVWSDGDGLHLSVTPATGVPYAVRTDPAGRVASVPGPTLGSMASLALFALMPQPVPTGLASPGGSATVTTAPTAPFTVAEARSHPASLLVESLIYGIDLALSVWGVSALPWDDVGNLECMAGLLTSAEAVSDTPQAATFGALASSLIGCAEQLVSDSAGQATFSWLAERGTRVLLGILGTGVGLFWSHVRGLIGELTGDGLVRITIEAEAEPLDEEALLAAPVPSLCEHPAGTLVDGTLPGIADREGHVSISRPDGTIPPDRVAYGDLDGDGALEAALVLSCSRGGVPWPEAIVVYGQGPSYLGHVDLGDFERDRPHVRSVRIVGGQVEAEIVGFVAPGDGACCGRTDAVARIGLADGTVQLAQIDFLDEADTVAALITALAAEDREEVRRLSTQVSIADFLFDSYAGATLELGECTSTSGHPWGEAMCRVGVTGSSEDPAEIYLRKVGFGEWLMEAFQSPRFVNH